MEGITMKKDDMNTTNNTNNDNDEAKLLFKKLSKKYKTLWTTLASDKFVIEEYQSHLSKFKRKERNSDDDDDENNINGSLNRKPLITLLSNSNDPDDQIISDSNHDDKERNDGQNTMPLRKANDFLTAINNINDTKMTSIFQIQTSCCDIFGCNNNCIEPIVVEEKEEEDCYQSQVKVVGHPEEDEARQVDHNENRKSDKESDITSNSIEKASDSENYEEKNETESNKNAAEVNLLPTSNISIDNTEEVPFSPIFTPDYQTYREFCNSLGDVGTSISVNSPGSNSSSSSGGNTVVLSFDLSHLLINDNETVIAKETNVTSKSDNYCDDKVAVDQQDEQEKHFSTEVNCNHNTSLYDLHLNGALEATHLSFSDPIYRKHDYKSLENVNDTTKTFGSHHEIKKHDEEENDIDNEKHSDSNTSSSSGSSELISFRLDESIFIEDDVVIDDNKEDNYIFDDANNDLEFNIRSDEESLKSSSSDEAEWIEKNEESSSFSSFEKEPEFNVVILSSDESESEHESDADTIDLVNTTVEVEDKSIENTNDSENDNLLVSAETKDIIYELEPKAKKRTKQKTHNERLMIPPPRLQSSKQIKISRNKFQNNREQLTKTLFQQFNTIVFQSSLTQVEVSWSSRLIKTAGLTRLKRIKRGTNTNHVASIELSTKLIDDEPRLKSTLMHEMCHAAAWIIDNVSQPPHGAVFKKWAKRSMIKIPNLIVSTTHDYVTNCYKFAWACTNETCDFIIQRHSRSVDVNRHCCGKCRWKLVEVEVPQPEDLKIGVFTPKQKRKASGFSLFVKEHSNIVRNRLVQDMGTEKICQKDVMRECAQLWNQMKNHEQQSQKD